MSTIGNAKGGIAILRDYHAGELCVLLVLGDVLLALLDASASSETDEPH